MARTKQTARKTVGGKAPRKYVPQQQQQQAQGGQHAPVITNKHKRRVAASGAADHQPPAAQAQQPELIPEITFTGSYDTASYAHYFATGDRETQRDVRCRYVLAHTRDPLLPEQDDCWLGVSYNSKFDGPGMKSGSDGRHASNRPDLNLVVALDVSGSMSCPFQSEEADDGGVRPTKLEVAKRCLLALVAQLRDGDSFGLVIFNSGASVVVPLIKRSDMNQAAVEKSIMKLRATGGTNISQGFKAATEVLATAEEGSNRSSRIFFLTDMEILEKDEETFLKGVVKNSEASIWSTIVGIGMDLARNTVEKTSKTPGCNYATVISSVDFKEMMDNEFDYTVTPIGFNVSLDVAPSWKLHSGYGSPEVSSLQPGETARHSTLFPCTQNEKGETRGGLFLFKLQPQDKESFASPFRVTSKWDNLLGVEQTDEQQLQFQEGRVEDNGIRKAVLLVYYTDFIRPYLEVRNKTLGLPNGASGVAAPMPTRYLNLITPEKRFQLLDKFIDHFKKEMKEIQDPALQDELDFLETIRTVEKPLFPNDAKEGSHGMEETDRMAEEANEKKRKHEEEEKGEVEKNEGGDEAKVRKVEGNEEDAGNGGKCVVCWDADKSVLFLPCRHLCACKACSDKSSDCPLCRQPILEKTSVFV